MIFSISLMLFSCADQKSDNAKEDTTQDTGALDSIRNPVLQGDFADPSVVRVGNDYWATATSSEWAPLYPILHSTDLQNWEIVDHVFPDGLPEWSEAHYWAPEIAYDNGEYYIYYTAKKKDGPLCVGVASSDNPKGPYKDHGPIVCQEAGAIDGFQIRDDQGKLFLIWKEDGNSRGEPTPMWGQEMNEARTELLGERFELFRNDPETWEGNLVEGAYLLKKDGYYYTFYSGDACCGRGCTYGIGVARAKNLQGPWEKYQDNPLKRENEDWKCAGHGSMVQSADGRYFFLYHAYSKDGFVYTGRQGLLDEIIWGEDGWPEFKENNTEKLAGKERDSSKVEYMFDADELSQNWQWPVGNKPNFTLGDNKLTLEAKPDKLGAVLAHRSLFSTYQAVTAIENDTVSNIQYGLAAIGDENNALGISYTNQQIILWKAQEGQTVIIARSDKNFTPKTFFKVEVSNGEEYTFFWSEDGENWQGFKDIEPLNGFYLPPWDRAIRIGLISKGEPSLQVDFDLFKMSPK
ncbi:family 43 glycosylhydrolase [Salinimicrobium sp. CDJ15-81-2]|nr:family 43 glycosylhydrolase [Salinimicrobium nanhaiense]